MGTRREQLLRKFGELLPGLSKDVATQVTVPEGAGGTPSAPTPSLALQWEVKEYPHFVVEFAKNGDDMVYHFWPPGQEVSFPAADHFHEALADGFVAVVPVGTPLRGDKLSARQVLAEQVLKYGAKDVVAQDTYYIRVVGLANNPLADKYLRDRVFNEIERAFERRRSAA